MWARVAVCGGEGVGRTGTRGQATGTQNELARGVPLLLLNSGVLSSLPPPCCMYELVVSPSPVRAARPCLLLAFSACDNMMLRPCAARRPSERTEVEEMDL